MVLTFKYSIVMARQALFPETVLDTQEVFSKEDSEEGTVDNDGDDEDVESLLAALAGWDSEKKNERNDTMLSMDLFETSSYGDVLTAELQAWRSKHAETDYSNWSSEKQAEFDVSTQVVHHLAIIPSSFKIVSPPVLASILCFFPRP
jgi:hypothetical protein